MRAVELPRSEAHSLLAYERDSLRARAASSARCAPAWHEAADEADRALRALRRHQDVRARRSALRIGPAWKHAADCEGWPTPPAAPGRDRTNVDPIDRFTIAHLAVGAVLGLAELPPWAALAAAVGWELVERPLKHLAPELFPHASHDSLPNSLFDAAAMWLGWELGRAS